MSSPYSSELESPRVTRAVLWLIAINVAIYFLQITVQEDLPAWLGFSTAAFASRQWWTALTYMFVHAGLWHLALNMYVLWAFGPRVERAWSTAGFTWYFLWCGLGGVLFHFMLDQGGLLVGASAAIYGVLLAYAVRWPNEEVYLFGIVPMKVKYLVGMFVLIDLVAGMSRTQFEAGGVAHLAHLGGLAFGGLYLLRPTAPTVDRLRQRVSQAPDISDDPPRAVPRSLPRPRERGSEADEAVEKSKAVNVSTARPAPPRPATTVVAPRTAELDLVLDKISQHGLESLTREERALLEEMSKRLRSGD